MIRPVRYLITMLLLAAMLPVTGCASRDRTAYQSTIHLPTTVAVRDTVTGQILWQLDIPVEHELTLDFDRVGEVEFARVRAEMPADKMTWRVRTRDRKQTVASGVQEMPAPHTIMTIVSYRPAPELPDDGPVAITPFVAGTAAGDDMRLEVHQVRPPSVEAPIDQPADSGEGDAATSAPAADVELVEDLDRTPATRAADAPSAIEIEEVEVMESEAPTAPTIPSSEDTTTAPMDASPDRDADPLDVILDP